MRQGSGFIVQILMFANARNLKIGFNYKKSLGSQFCGILDPAAVQDYTKFLSSITNVFIQLVRDINNGVCYHCYEERLEQQKGRLNVNVGAAEENLEESIHYRITFSIQISPII